MMVSEVDLRVRVGYMASVEWEQETNTSYSYFEKSKVVPEVKTVSERQQENTIFTMSELSLNIKK